MRLQNGDVLFLWPLAQHLITAGWTYNDGSAHSAIDLRAAIGTPTQHQARQAACRIGQLKHADMHNFRVKHVDGVVSYKIIKGVIKGDNGTNQRKKGAV